MTEAGIQMGLAPGAAASLAAGTLRGAAKLLEASGEPPEELRRKVTSPGGTTAAGIDVFEKKGLKSIIVEAIAAATRRAQELSG
jgi:pyrroline-5-carboxylate reductase